MTLDHSAPVCLEMAPRGPMLVFGLAWSPAIGSRVPQLARRRAAAARASHYTFCGQRGVAVGSVRLPRAGRARPYHSAAALFARAHGQGAVAACIEIPDNGVWVVAACDGAVMCRTDRFYPNAQEALAAVGQLAAHTPGLRWIDSLGRAVDEGSGLLGPSPASAMRSPSALDRAWFVAQLAADPPLRTLVRPGRWTALALAASTVGLATKGALMVTADHPLSASHAPARALSPQEIEHLWQAARQRALDDVWTGAAGVDDVLRAIRQLPTSSHGWRLAGVECDWQSAAWQCAAAYGRASPLATNRELWEALGQTYAVTFTPFSQARAAWQVDAPRRAQRAAELADASWVEVTWASALQRLAPAMARMAMAAPERVDVPVPLDPGTGQGLSPPATAPVIRRRAVELEGPLRTFGLLPLMRDAVAWTHMSVGVDRHAPVALDRSVVQVSLQGWIYEQTNLR